MAIVMNKETRDSLIALSGFVRTQDKFNQHVIIRLDGHDEDIEMLRTEIVKVRKEVLSATTVSANAMKKYFMHFKNLKRK